MNDYYIKKHVTCDDISRILLREKGMYAAFFIMTEEYIHSFAFPELVSDHKGYKLIPNDEYVIITCSNNYRYHINVTGNSIASMCAEVFNFIQNK